MRYLQVNLLELKSGTNVVQRTPGKLPVIANM